jgi:hypothetical protein
MPADLYTRLCMETADTVHALNAVVGYGVPQSQS